MKNQVKGIIRLNGQKINNQIVSCTGLQLAEILNFLLKNGSEFRWLVADLSTNNGFIPRPIDNLKISYLENTKQLIDFSVQIDQLWSGIFLAIPKSINKINWKRDFDTEDEPSIDLGYAVLEIRAFDSNYFEIYSSDTELLKLLSKNYNTEIESTGFS